MRITHKAANGRFEARKIVIRNHNFEADLRRAGSY